jgi:dihydroorotase
MRPLLITGGRIIDPSRNRDEIGDLLIVDGKIANGASPADCDWIDAGGMVVCPGFIDLHCHLREPGFEEKETVATGTQAAARGGFTTVCCMPNTSPPTATAETVERVYELAARDAAVRVLPIGCISAGRKGNVLGPLKKMAEAGAVAFSDDGSPVLDDDLMKQALLASRELGLPIIDHCEDTRLTMGAVMNEGKVSVRLGLRGFPAAAEENMVARDLALARETGGRLHIAHLSTAGSVELVRQAKQEGVTFTCEVTPHHLTLTEDEVIWHSGDAKVSPPLRTEKDIQALIRAVRDGVIDVIATDHAPHTPAEKQRPLSEVPFGIIGLETALGSLMLLVQDGQLSLPNLIEKLTAAPARVLGGRYGKLGTLASGSHADVTIFDPRLGWTVDPASFASKGRNTPLAGAVLHGRIMATICGGNIVYQDDSLRTNAND